MAPGGLPDEEAIGSDAQAALPVEVRELPRACSRRHARDDRPDRDAAFAAPAREEGFDETRSARSCSVRCATRSRRCPTRLNVDVPTEGLHGRRARGRHDRDRDAAASSRPTWRRRHSGGSGGAKGRPTQGALQPELRGCHTLAAAGSTRDDRPEPRRTRHRSSERSSRSCHGGGGMPAFEGQLTGRADHGARRVRRRKPQSRELADLLALGLEVDHDVRDRHGEALARASRRRPSRASSSGLPDASR